MGWWTTVACDTDIGGPHGSCAFNLVDLSPFALGDGLSDGGDDGWGSFEERWKEEHLWVGDEGRGFGAHCDDDGGNVCACDGVFMSGGSGEAQSWWGEGSLHLISSCGKLFTTGNDQSQH